MSVRLRWRRWMRWRTCWTVRAGAGRLPAPHRHEPALVGAARGPGPARADRDAARRVLGDRRRRPAVPLDPGAVAVMKGPEAFTFADDPQTPPRSWSTRAAAHARRRRGPRRGHEPRRPHLGQRPGRGGSSLIGCFQMRGEVSRRLLDALPTLLVLTPDTWDSPLVRLLDEEIVRDEPGQPAVLDRLFDLLLIAVVRAWFARPEAAAPAWYRAHNDPVIGRAVRHAARRPRPSLDCRPAGGRRRDHPRAVRPTLHRGGRPAPDDVPHRAGGLPWPPIYCASPTPPSRRSPVGSAIATASP